MEKQFKPETYGRNDITVHLTRKQLEHMLETVNTFKEVDEFHLEVSNPNDSGTNQQLKLTFDIKL